ncbi:MAG: HRDC domain-containing protein [Proteobacteria bacterium]|nr:HRDC domain-containing protein [Pseudomonadota bacterium]
MLDYLFIENERDLKTVSDTFGRCQTIAVDLEADSMFHFKEKVCLIQMASDSLTVVIDPLKINDMSPLKPVFSDPDIRKIFHGSDYDVRSLNRDYDIHINNLFDTELASRFLGINETGLSSVLGQRFNVRLDKSYQKKDWSQRPLPRGMIEYGACDVLHLLPLADILDSELKEKKRTEWVREECELLSRVRCPSPNGDALFLRVKGSGRLDRRALGTLERLLHLRLSIAEKKDKPLFKIIGNATLLEIARKRPRTMDILKGSKLLSPRQIDTFGQDILHEINEGLNIPEKDLPIYPRKKKPAIKPDVPKRIDGLKDWRDGVATELCVDPPILLNKSLLTEIAITNPANVEDLKTVQGIKNWQINEFGDQIIGLLNHRS